jgi:hypothetical protein
MTDAIILNTAIPFVGKTVVACVTSEPMARHGFHTQISVQGKLERHSENGQYRVLCTASSYAYFEEKDIDTVLTGSGGWTTKTGAAAVIYLKVREAVGSSQSRGLRAVLDAERELDQDVTP